MTTSRTTSPSKYAALVGALAITLFSLRAQADAVPPPPTGCPAGSVGGTCHGGVYCQPSDCKTSADCQGGQVCQPLSLCVGKVVCYGGIAGPDGGAVTNDQPNVEGACSGTGPCGDAGAMCTTLSVCVSPSASSSSSSGGISIQNGCSCATIGGSDASFVLGMLALGAVGLGLTGRLRARAEAQRASRQRRE
jgi:hypothetical protein